MIPINMYMAVSACLFILGGIGFLVRRNVLFSLMSIELMLNASNLALVAYNRIHPMNPTGHIFAFFVVAVAAAEVSVGLAIVLSLNRLKQTVYSDEADLLKN